MVAQYVPLKQVVKLDIRIQETSRTSSFTDSSKKSFQYRIE